MYSSDEDEAELTVLTQGVGSGEDEMEASMSSVPRDITKQPLGTDEDRYSTLKSTAKSSTQNADVADPTVVLGAEYIESYVIGGGASWLYSGIEFLMEVLRVLKKFGIPFMGQVMTFCKRQTHLQE